MEVSVEVVTVIEPEGAGHVLLGAPELAKAVNVNGLADVDHVVDVEKIPNIPCDVEIFPECTDLSLKVIVPYDATIPAVPGLAQLNALFDNDVSLRMSAPETPASPLISV